MKLLPCIIVTLIVSSFIFGGCSSEPNQQGNAKEVVLGKLELTDGWARPAAKGATGGAYLTIANGTASRDTLKTVTSDVSNRIEIHETYKNEDGTMGMRPAGSQIIDQAEKLRLKPGGLHIMMMNLNRELAVGDSVSLILQFSRVGTKNITLPVQIQ